MLLIVISGPPATGKTNIANALSKKLRLPVIAKDAIKETLYDTLGSKNRAWSKKLGRASYQILLHYLGLLLASKHNVIVEGNFSGTTGQAIARLAKRHRAKVIQIRCDAADDVITRRFVHRWVSGQRHRGHHDGNYFSPATLKQRQVERRWRIGSHRLDLDESRPESANIRSALRFVRKYI